MKEFKDKFKQIKKKWSEVYKDCTANPSNFTTHVSDVSLQDINYLMEILETWFDRQKAIKGGRPVLDISKSIIIVELENMHTPLNALSGGQYNTNNWNSLIRCINSIMSALHSSFYFSNDDDVRSNIGELYEFLVQNVNSVKDIKKEMESYISDVKNYKSDLEESRGLSEEISGFYDSYQETKQQIDSLAIDVSKKGDSVSETMENIESDAEELSKLKNDNEKLKNDFQDQIEKIQGQVQKVDDIQTICDSLLKTATTAGLSRAFAYRADKISKGKNLWGAAFIVAVVALAVVAFILFPMNEDIENTDKFILFLKRLPVTVPLIWLAWFSAVQYGNNLRLQEDYEFKSSTCKAFDGFHEHFARLSKYSGDDGITVLQSLSSNTVKILADEPGRKLGRSDKEATFLNSLSSCLWGRGKRDGE